MNRLGTPRELFHQVMQFECPGHTLLTLGGIWPSCFERWGTEGMPDKLGNIPALLEHFGLMRHTWGGPAAELFVYPPFEYRVVSETETTITYTNGMGITCTEFKKDAYKSMPHFESFPVQNRKDWEQYRERLQWDTARVGNAWGKQVAGFRASDAPVIIALNRGASLYGALRDMVGVEGLSFLFYDDPELVAEMMDTMLALFLNSVEALFDEYVPDAVCMWEDMAYKNGSLLGVQHVREFMLPRYRVMTAKLREKGIRYILLDSDGKIHDLIPTWLEAGIDGVVPMEAQAGMDVATFRQKYPRMLMMGGIDKKALAGGRETIDREINKARRTIASGGYIPFFDHGLPHDVSWQDFVYFVEQLKTLG